MHPRAKELLRKAITLVLFIFIYYAVTNNRMVKPLTTPIAGKWSIEKAQSSLAFGLASHNYLILRNAEGNVERELHGTPIEKDGSFKRIALTSGDTLHVLEFAYPLYGERSYRPSAVTVFSGNKEEVHTKWNEGLVCLKNINTKEIPYPPFGINIESDTLNSNSVATTLLSCMSLPSPQVGLLTPGSQNLISK